MADPGGFADHFSAVAADYAGARPEYPDALFAWIAAAAPATALAWEPGCGSGQASRGLARHFRRVHASDPSAAQIAQACGPGNVAFAVERGERCSLDTASVDAVCVAQALHWFEREAFFAQCARVLRPGGVLVAWGYQDIVVPAPLAAANAALQAAIRPYWPAERALVDAAYAGFDWPFPALTVPAFELRAQWTLPRLLGYFASYSASRRCRDATGQDPVAAQAPALTAAWGDPEQAREVRWPLFVHARRKAAS
ncbi:class I SAM-dependent methyltransferase [Cognatiluteimonas weifangensis]|uniref:Class I SAM-dependent methyltransferase n=1 Tax=Cognatiluteimonas weifangensis TaxID=2303539 RepID=A0A372DLR2_9GAMM|nr:class I SAM-dependent methyltransferase [Luteimonas weifangensis]RFP60511.1 class I SAM-dependent methyltransferase [Luteimonas weifangensis]